MTDLNSTDKFTQQEVLSVRHWQSPGLISIRVTRDPSFQFAPGQFARIGLRQNAQDLSAPPDLWRAYSMVSHPRENYLEFLSVTVPNGLFSPKLANLQAGDSLWVEKSPFGFLTLDRFSPAQTLWLVATGTGLSAYIPMLLDHKTWDNFESVVLVHGVRTEAELTYREDLEQLKATHGQFVYLPVLSQQTWQAQAQAPCRITTAYQSGLLEAIAQQTLDPQSSRIMLCGNPGMVTEMRSLLSEKGFAAGRRGNLGNLAVENYW